MPDMPPEEHRLTPDTLPTPFSAAQIRAACAPGRSNTFRVDRRDAAPYLMQWEFVGGDEEGAESVRWTEALDGTPLEERTTSRSRWTEFQGHASYPVNSTTIGTDTIEIPAGRFECWLYTTRSDDGEVTRAWFARNLPGPPVLVRSEAGGAVEFSSTLVRVAGPRE